MTPALLLVTLLQVAAPEVSASVDRARLAAGEELILTILARTRTAEPLELGVPVLSGFTIVGSRDLTDVSVTGPGGMVRTQLRELRLRAQRPGPGLIGPVRGRQGSRVVETAPIAVVIDSAGAASAAALGSIALALVETAPPPSQLDDIAVTLVASADTVLAGQQLDLVSIAWVPRLLRARLRRPPTLRAPTPAGVWARPTAVLAGAAASRRLGADWADLFVAHQVVFPLAPGRLVIPPASVEYALPVTYSFFSREDRYSRRSDSLTLTVVSPPAAGRPADDRGVVAEGVTLELTVAPPTARVGEPVEVAARLSGIGNVALWPEPELRVATGLRAYPAEPALALAATGARGRLGGVKTFRMLVVPDSAGTFVLPEVRYPYYDLARRTYTAAVAGARPLVVAPGAEPRAARALPPVLATGRPGSADRLAAAPGPWGWIAAVLLPPLIVLAVRRRAARPASPPPESGPPVSTLGRLEAEFRTALSGVLPDPAAREGPGLADSLRAAGLDRATAGHIVRVRDRLLGARYGHRVPENDAQLVVEAERALEVLSGTVAGATRARRTVLIGLWLALLLPRAGGAQAPSAERLYEAGALRAAADSFAARAARDPAVAAHWYNLGVTLYRAGADGEAGVALLRAARLAPRDRVIHHARTLLPPPDAASEPLVALGPATPGEWVLLAAAGWLAVWALVALRRSRVAMLAVGALTLAAGVLAGLEMRRRARPLVLVVVPSAPVRAAPYGAASVIATLDGGAALLAGERYGPWLEVRRADGIRGWVLGDQVEWVAPRGDGD